jgi:hypothetical protein
MNWDDKQHRDKRARSAADAPAKRADTFELKAPSSAPQERGVFYRARLSALNRQSKKNRVTLPTMPWEDKK